MADNFKRQLYFAPGIAAGLLTTWLGGPWVGLGFLIGNLVILLTYAAANGYITFHTKPGCR